MRGFVLALILVGCHPSRPLERVTAKPKCPATVVPTMADACDGRFTRDGYLCVNCKGAIGCFDNTDGVYCANPNCKTDKACHRE